jgi:hypothetical protein
VSDQHTTGGGTSGAGAQSSGAGGALPPPAPDARAGDTQTSPSTDALADYSSTATDAGTAADPGQVVEPGDAGDRGSRRRRRILVASAIGVGVLVLPFAGYLAIDAATSDGGADSPEAAVQAMFDAIGDEDVLGVMDTVLPGERRSLGEPVQDIVDELRRLEVLSDDADLGDVEGIDLEFTDLTYSTEDIAEGIAVVEVTGGTVDGAAELDELPLGDLLIDLGFDGERPTGSEQASGPLEGGARLATVEEDGRWYVSLWFTVAEAARTAAGAPAPDPAQAIEPTGSESPEQVLDDVLTAVGQLDLTAMLGLLPPGEARALHVYGPMFLDDAQASLDELRAESGFSLRVDESEYEVDRDGSRATVVPSSIAVTIEADGETASVAFADGCVTVEAGGEREELCADDADDFLAEAGVDTSTGTSVADDPDTEDVDESELGVFGGLADLEDVDAGFEVVEEDGRWYLSPTATLLRPLIEVLEALEAEDIREIADAAENGFSVNVDTAEDA